MDAFALLELVEELFNIAGFLFQDLFGAVENSHFCFDFVELFLHGFELVVFDTEVGGILTEVILLHVLLTFGLNILLFFVS